MPTLLAVIAHPDDESYSFGGTLALAAQAGWRCHVLSLTSGEGGKRNDGGPDGQVQVDLLAGDVITIRRSRRAVQLLHPGGSSFFDTLRQKLHWSGSNV